MNILFVTAVLPYPLHSGGQIRVYNLLKRLSRKHTITLVSFIRDESERDLAVHLDFCHEVHMVMRGGAWQPGYVMRSIFGRFPFLLATYDNAQMRQLIRDCLVREQYDLVHIEPFYVWPSLPSLTIPLVVSEHNIEYHVYDQYVKRFWLVPVRPLLWIDVAKLRFWERLIWKAAKRITAVSEEDKSVIFEHSQGAVTVVANGVDLSQFTAGKKERGSSDPTLLFVGDFRWFPNIDAVRTLIWDIWPNVRKRYPGAKLHIVGRHLGDTLRSDIVQSGAQLFTDVDDIAAQYRDADFLVAPHTISGGTKFKMIEAMASGLAIVTTAQGVTGLGVKAGVHYSSAHTPDEYVASIENLWEHKTLYTKQTKAARLFVQKTFSWDVIDTQLEEVWKSTHENT